MRTTAVCLAQHIGRGFRFQWHLKARRKIQPTGAAEVLTAKGIQIHDPKDILTPPYARVLELPECRIEVKEVEPDKKPCYIFHDLSSLPAKMPQAQNLTNTIVHPTLPQKIVNHLRDNSEEEDSKVQNVILHSHLLDSHQEKLPIVIDVINSPGIRKPRVWGSPVRRKNYQLTYKLQLLLDQLYPDSASHRPLMTNTKSQVFLEHSDQLMQMKFKVSAVLVSPKPLAPIAEEEEILASEKEILPDIYPLSPFLHCQKHVKYSDEEYDCLATKVFYPHTLFVHMNMPRPPHGDEDLCAISVLKAFAHSAAYAKSTLKVENGNLETPITMQVVHTTGRKFHFGVFQLNTLNMNGPRKNIFWSHPMESLFDICNFKGAEPILKGYNPTVFKLLRAFHAQ